MVNEHDATVRKRLFDELRRIHDNRDFIIGVMSNAPHTEDRETILQFIENGKDVTKKNLILLSLQLGNERNN